jgi:hypothetical protein
LEAGAPGWQHDPPPEDVEVEAAPPEGKLEATPPGAKLEDDAPGAKLGVPPEIVVATPPVGIVGNIPPTVKFEAGAPGAKPPDRPEVSPKPAVATPVADVVVPVGMVDATLPPEVLVVGPVDVEGGSIGTGVVDAGGHTATLFEELPKASRSWTVSQSVVGPLTMIGPTTQVKVVLSLLKTPPKPTPFSQDVVVTPLPP